MHTQINAYNSATQVFTYIKHTNNHVQRVHSIDLQQKSLLYWCFIVYHMIAAVCGVPALLRVSAAAALLLLLVLAAAPCLAHVTSAAAAAAAVATGTAVAAVCEMHSHWSEFSNGKCQQSPSGAHCIRLEYTLGSLTSISRALPRCAHVARERQCIA
jgi:hypothetical protein